MAEIADIQHVLDNIESDYTAHGWAADEIADRIDGGAIWQRVVSAYWAMRATQTILLVNVSESGSSRGMDAVYARMKALADDWDAKADAIENPAVADATARISSFALKRV